MDQYLKGTQPFNVFQVWKYQSNIQTEHSFLYLKGPTSSLVEMQDTPLSRHVGRSFPNLLNPGHPHTLNLLIALNFLF